MHQIVLPQVCKGESWPKYNTLMHFLNVAKCYWANPDVDKIQVFGKDVHALFVVL